MKRSNISLFLSYASDKTYIHMGILADLGKSSTRGVKIIYSKPIFTNKSIK
jgi:hypothetical protein